jgi:hypothetical protein
MPILIRAEKVGSCLKKLESGAALSPEENSSCHEVTTTEVFGYSEAERCTKIDEVGECYKAKVDLLNGAAQKMVAVMKNEPDADKQK